MSYVEQVDRVFPSPVGMRPVRPGEPLWVVTDRSNGRECRFVAWADDEHITVNRAGLVVDEHYAWYLTRD